MSLKTTLLKLQPPLTAATEFNQSIIITFFSSSHYSDVIVNAMASWITGVLIACSTACSGADQRKHQSSASLAFMGVIHRWSVDSLHKGPVTWKILPFDEVVMLVLAIRHHHCHNIHPPSSLLLSMSSLSPKTTLSWRQLQRHCSFWDCRFDSLYWRPILHDYMFRFSLIYFAIIIKINLPATAWFPQLRTVHYFCLLYFIVVLRLHRPFHNLHSRHMR